MSPIINVNLTKCDDMCSSKWQPEWVTPRHSGDCTPVTIPLSLQPFRSVTVTVRLGECDCPPPLGHGAYGHSPNCAARPIRVSCSISGETWEESRVFATEADGHADDSPVLIEAANERWALVKALLLGETPADPFGRPVIISPLFLQRDAVFSALADMARAEQALEAATGRVNGLLQRPPPAPGRQLFEARDSQAEEALRIYVERIVEQVGIL